MSLLFIITFALTLVYLSITERFRNYVYLITLQGVLLFIISFLELTQVSMVNLVFIATETLLFKAFVVPALLRNIIKKTGIAKVHANALPGIYSIMFVSLGIVLSIAISFSLHEKMAMGIYFTTAIFAVFTGLFLIISHKKIFSHLIGFLVLENAVFLLSLAVGNEMPMLINIGILLDIFASVLILGIFMMRIGSRLQDIEADSLGQLRD
jgi:hydrogenase-4 component E